MTPNPRLILIRQRCLARSNRLRAFARHGWHLLPLILAGTIVIIYGALWLQSLIRQAVTLTIAGRSLAASTAWICLALGPIAGCTATSKDRKAIDAPFLTILPWPHRVRRDAVLLSLLSRLATSATLLGSAILASARSSATSLPFRRAIVAALLYGVGFGAGSALNALLRSPRTPGRTPHPARTSIPVWVTRFDRFAPRWAGWWSLASRLRQIGILGTAAWAASLTIAEAAAHGTPPVTIAPGLAAIGPLIVLFGAIGCAPLTSPVLRTSPIRYHRAALAMLRLPAGLAAAWFALFAAAALILDLARLRAIAAAGAFALLLGLGYALAALSIPRSKSLALGFYLTALAFAADQYASLQNLVFLILFALLVLLVLRARAVFRATR